MSLILKLQKKKKERLCLKYAQRCLTDEKASNIFPENEKSHGMKTRNTDKYKVEHANTDRFKSSAKIYIKKLRNKNVKTLKYF